MPAGTWPPRYTSKSRTSASSLPPDWRMSVATWPAGTASSTIRARSSKTAGCDEKVSYFSCCVFQPASRTSRSSSITATGMFGKSNAAGLHLGVELAGPRLRSRLVDQQLGRPARVQRRVSAAFQGEIARPNRPKQRLDHTFQVEKAHWLRVVFQPYAALAWAWSAALRVGAARRAALPRVADTDPPNLENRNTLHEAQVSLCCLNERRQQRDAEVTVFDRQGVEDGHMVALEASPASPHRARSWSM